MGGGGSPYLSIVVPLYNEEECVERLYRRIRAEADKLGRSYEIIFVDDGSRDRTFAVAAGLIGPGSRLRLLKFRRNSGQTAAMSAGFEAARGEVIVTMDGDLQNDPADMGLLLDELDKGFDVVSGWRFKRQDRYWTRKFPSRIANWLISSLTGTRLHDYGCSLKAYRARFVKPIHFYAEMHRFFPAIVAALAGARTAEIRVSHFPRTTGRSKYGLMRIFRVMADLVTIQMLTRFLKKPVYWFGIMAVPFVLLGSVLLGFSVFEYSRSTEQMFIVPAISFLVLGAAFHFIVQGLLAEYIVSTGETDRISIITFESLKMGEAPHAHASH